MSFPTSPQDPQNPQEPQHDAFAAQPAEYALDPHMSPAEARALLNATRRNRLARFTPAFERTIGFIRDHWLAIINTGMAVYIGISLIVPLAYAAGFTGPANAVFDVYRFFCAQTPSHSFFIAGYQTCLCSRCLAIYASILLAGVTFAVLRNNRRLRSLPWYAWLVGMVPMALDGFTQLFGLRESNLALRLLTGLIFGVATAWFLFPQIEEAATQEQPAPNPAAYAAYASQAAYAPKES